MLNPDQLAAVELDVSDLVPPEPLFEIFRALMTLPAGHRLDVYHRRQPFPLYDMLTACGFLHRCQPQSPNYRIQIWPGPDANVEALSRLVAQAPDCQP